MKTITSRLVQRRLAITFCIALFSLSFEQVFATSYTWSGLTSTSWNTNTNWTPNGIPGSGDNITIVTATNNLTLTGDQAVINLTLSSGTLDLQSYTLTVAGNTTTTGGTVTSSSGKLLIAGSGTTAISGTQFNTWTSITANTLTFKTSTFGDTLKIIKKGSSSDVSKGGNTFNGYTSIIDSATGTITFGDSLGDTFNSFVYLRGINTTGKILIANRGTNVFNGSVKFDGGSIQSNTFGIATYNGPVEVNNSASGSLAFGASTGSTTFTSTFVLGSSGFTIGGLVLKNTTFTNPLITTTLTLTGSGQLHILSGCLFKGPVNFTSPSIVLSGGKFEKPSTFVKSGTTSTLPTSLGGNRFYDNVSFTNSFNGAWNLANTSVDTFDHKATFIQNNSSSSSSFSFNHGLFNDTVEFINTSSPTGERFNIANTGNCVFNGVVSIKSNPSGSTMVFCSSAGSATFSSSSSLSFLSGSGDLRLKNCLVNSNNATTIPSGTINRLTLNSGCTFAKSFNFTGPSISVEGCIFNEDVNIVKTGSANDVWSGGNTFNGITTIEDNNTTLHSLTMCSTSSDYFNGDVTFRQTGSGGTINLCNSKNAYFSKNLYLSCVGQGITIGNSIGGRAVFSGTANQNISVSSGLPLFRKVEVNKSKGYIQLLSSLSIIDTLFLSKGIIKTDTTNLLILRDSITVIGGSDSSFVEGSIKKIGNDSFTFPIGSKLLPTGYHPISITAPSNISDEIVASYYPVSSPHYTSFSTHRISYSEYWTLEQKVGNSNIVVSVGWNSNSILMDDTSKNFISQFINNNWNSLGKSAISVTGYAGIITALQSVNLVQGQKQEFVISRLGLPASGPVTDPDPYRGMYVNYFGPRAGFWWNGTWIPPHFTHILGNTTLEDALLNYALDNNIKRLDLYQLRPDIIYNPTGINPNSGDTWQDDLCDFMIRAKTDFCIEEFGAVGASVHFFDEVDGSIFLTPPYNLDNSSITNLRTKLPYLVLVEQTYTAADGDIAALSEYLKYYLRVNDWNATHQGGPGAITCTFDIMTVELEWWWTPAEWTTFNNVINFLRALQPISTNPFRIHNYVGYIHDLTVNGSLVPETAVADIVDDGSDKIYLVDYQLLPQHLWSTGATPITNCNAALPSCFTHSLDLLGQNVNHPNSIIAPLFSAEPHLSGGWLNSTEENTIQNFEREFFQEVPNNATLIGDNILTNGSVQWFAHTFGRQIPTLWQGYNLWGQVPPGYSQLGYNYCTNNVAFHVGGSSQVCDANNLINVCLNENVNFEICSNYEPNVTFDFDFGDGTVLTGLDPVDANLDYTILSHTYTTAGTCTVTCTLHFPNNTHNGNICSYTYQRIVVISGPVATASIINETCLGSGDGSCSLSVSGGATPYTFAWSNGGNTSSISNLIAGTYTCIITDASGCSTSISATVNSGNSVSISTNNPTICIGGDATIATTVSVSGGTYSWTPTPPGCNNCSTAVVSPSTQTTYTVSYSVNGCNGSTTSTVSINQACCGNATDDVIFNPLGLSTLTLPPGTYTNGTSTVKNLNCHIEIYGSVIFSGLDLIIAEGKQITVKNGGTLDITDVSWLRACGNMWKGINVELGGTVYVRKTSTIEDAQYGVMVQDGSTLTTDAAIFNSNFVGIYAPPQIGGNISLATISIRNTKFTSTKVHLNPPYPGQAPFPRSKTFAGVVINDLAQLNFSQTSPGNIFDGLNFGIYSRNSNLSANLVVNANSVFENILRYDWYSFQSPFPVNTFARGSGIYAEGTGSERLYLTGNATTSSTAAFTNCIYGIYTQKMHTSVHHTKIDNTNEGVVVLLGQQLSTIIMNNIITASISGLRLGANNNPANMIVNMNTITILNSTASIYCIRVYNNNIQSQRNQIINYNNLYQGTSLAPISSSIATHGIGIYGTHNYYIGNNNIFMDNVVLAPLGEGINVTNCTFSDLKCNYILGGAYTLGTSNQFGIHTIHSPDYAYMCNWTHKVYEGLNFNSGGWSVNSAWNSLQSNDINEHTYGLRINASGRTGPQFHMGNQWLGTYVAGAGVLNDGITDLYTFNPTIISHAPVNPPANMFLPDNSVGDATCNRLDLSVFCDWPTVVIDPHEVEQLAIKIAQDSVHTSEYDNLTVYNARRTLMDLLNKHSDLREEQLDITKFFDDYAYSSLGYLSQVKLGIDTICNLDTLEISEMEEQLNALAEYQDLIALNDSLVNNDTTLTSTEIAALLDENQDHRVSIVGIAEILRGLYANYTSDVSSLADILLVRNDTIIGNSIIEDNEISVNDIFLNTIAKGIIPDSATYWSTLFEIAKQCPHTGGLSVYRARALYALLDQEHYFDDDRTCISPDTCLVPPIPQSIVTESSNGLCGTTIELNVSEEDAIIYEWYVDGDKLDEESATLVHTVSNEKPGSLICAKSVNDCGVSMPRCIVVYGQPTGINPESIVGDQDVCEDDIKQYSWDEVEGATSYTIVAPSDATILTSLPITDPSVYIEWGELGGYIGVIAVNDCGVSDTVFYQVNNTCRKSLRENHDLRSNVIRIFPNPTTGQSMLVYQLENDHGKIEFYNPLGEKVREFDLPGSGNLMTLNLGDIKSTILEFRVFDKDMLISRGKVVIMK